MFCRVICAASSFKYVEMAGDLQGLSIGQGWILTVKKERKNQPEIASLFKRIQQDVF